MLTTKLPRSLLVALALAICPSLVGTQASAQVQISASSSWTPPIGIPRPDFGIEQSHYMYQLGAAETCQTQPGKCYDFGGGPEPYRDAGGGPYTHYVDPSSTACTNTSNVYGTSEHPRCSMPAMSTVQAGAVIEIHGNITQAIHSRLEITAVGTSVAPIFIRGASFENKGTFSNVVFRVRGQYLILENLTFATSGPDIRPASTSERVHHVALRHSYLHERATTSVAGLAGSPTQQVVFYDNQIHSDQFDPLGGEFPELDRHGVSFGSYDEYVWIVDNDISGQSGDAVGNGHAAQYTTKHFFIGRNRLHDTGENGVDLKEVEDFVISQNKIYNFTGLSSGSDGTAVVIHYGPSLSPKNTWFIFNEIYNATDKGIQVGGSQVPESYFIGNVVHDIHNANGTARGFETWGSCKINLIGNTFANNDNGITASGTSACGKLVLRNNIIANLATGGGFTIDRLSDSGYAAAAEIWDNLLFPAGPSPGVTCAACIVGEPMFINPTAGDFHLRIGSPAINAANTNVSELLAATFYGFFGLDIRKDADGRARPAGGADDLGAFEFESTPPPLPPSGLRILN
jgi:hypothetical protein